jgi:transaldolase
VRGHYAGARQVLSDLATLGINYDDVMQVLEDHGLAAFDASWQELGAQLKGPATREGSGE